MELNNYIAMIPDYVLGKLTKEQEEAFLNALKSSKELQRAYDSWDVLEHSLQDLNEAPSKDMDATFYEFLNDAIENEETSNVKVRQLHNPRKSWWVPMVAAGVMLLLGLFLGKSLWEDTVIPTEEGITEVEFQSSKQETEAVRTQLVISLADEPSAARRLEAISEAKKLETATDKVIEALFKMLNSDPNVNVRLAAVTSLSKYVDNPTVREGLVMSIVHQDSPHVQIALAELMVELKEKESIRSIEELLQKESTNQVVKEKLQESINQIL